MTAFVAKIVFGAIVVIGLAIGALGTWFTTDEGYNYVVQNTWTGGMDVINGAGTHGKLPFFTRVTEYKQVATIDISGVTRNGQRLIEANIGKFTRQQAAAEVDFADTYTGDISATFRFRLPSGKEEMLHLHEEFRSFDNLVDSLLVRNAIDVTVVTATQYTGEEFFQGGVNAYKVQLVDQLQNGLYVTQRQQVLVVDTEIAPVSAENDDANTMQEVTRKVWKSVILLNADGLPRRQVNPFDQYGIVASQVTLGKALPSDELDKLLDDKRARIGRRIAAIEQLATAEAEAQAVQQSEEIETVRQVQIAQRAKDLAVIEAQQLVEVERQNATRETVVRNKDKALAVIDKERELAVAEANRNIQEAAAEAALFEAEAIIAVGLAEAEVSEAMLQAKQSAMDIYLAEIERDIANVMYPALRNVTIDMPDYYSAGGTGEAAPTSLDVLTTLGAMRELDSRNTAPAQ